MRLLTCSGIPASLPPDLGLAFGLAELGFEELAPFVTGGAFEEDFEGAESFFFPLELEGNDWKPFPFSVFLAAIFLAAMF
jgi:hypothetical protein